MKIKPDFKLRNIAGENIVVALGKESKRFKGVIMLNDSSTLLWKKAESGCGEDELVDALKSEYGLDDETAKRGVDKFVKLVNEHGFVE